MPLSTILANATLRCTAKCKATQSRCWNLAAYGCKTCYVHGAFKNRTYGTNHPNWKHGFRTKAAEREASQTAARLRELEAMARDAGMLSGPRTRGRKPV